MIASERMKSDIDDASLAAETCAASRRASWVGVIKLGSVELPVKAYSATNSDVRASCHLIHRRCGQRIKSPRCCPEHGAVEAADVSRAIVTPEGEELILSDQELEQLRPPTCKEITLNRFVRESEIDPIRISGRHHYLLPDGATARPPFASLTEALRSDQHVGIGMVMINGRDEVAAIVARENRLTLHYFYGCDEIRAFPDRDRQFSVPVPHEVKNVRRYISDHAATVDWSHMRDRTMQRLEDVIGARLQPAGPQNESRNIASSNGREQSHCTRFDPPVDGSTNGAQRVST